jgi:carboxyl-terminal processing protease
MNFDPEPQSSQSLASQRISPLLIGCGAITISLLIFLAGLGVGFGAGRLGDVATSLSGGAMLDAVAGNERVNSRGELDPEFDVFWEAMDLLYRDFYGALPEGEETTYGAIRGVVNLLDDPNTSFLTPDEADFFRSSMRGNFEGIGARVQWDEDFNSLVIIEPFENQPAWNAGIRRDDIVIEVDGESIVGSNLNEAVSKIRGPKGSSVVLTIVREGEAEPFEVEVVRDLIETPTISTDSLGSKDEFAYVRLTTFNENAGQLVRQAVEDAVDRNAAGLVLDLRGNTGGLLREAVKVTSVFLGRDERILIERFNDGTEDYYETEGTAVTEDLPLVVLVNGGSASASEIVAGALQDADRAELIGTTTFGKGSVQLPHTLSDGSIMRVTIARWYTPDDRSIDGTGLDPDTEVEISDEQFEAGDDPQLDAAIEYLETQINESTVEAGIK